MLYEVITIGNYTLSDQVEVTNDRVNIEEDSSEIDTGYLIEMRNNFV